jgi:exoribonuclease R
MAAGTFEPHEWRHFALNIPYYTHFTSPIRRYADVMVHRLLQATIEANLNEKIIFNLEQHEIQAICEHCNEKKMASKAAQDRSDRVFLAIYLKHNPIRSTLGVVISVGERTFTIFIKELGCSGKLFLDEHKDMVDSEPYTANSGQRRIRLKSKGETDWSEIDIKVFSMLKVSVLCKEKPPIDIKLRLESPWSG